MNKSVGIFAENGYYKTTTAMIAAAAGVTQPYIFHFFKNKEELYNAVIDRAANRIYEVFSKVEAPADQLMETMGKAFIQIMQTHRDEIIMVMQAHSIPEPVIREHVKEKFLMVHQSYVAKFKRFGIPDAEMAASQFLGMGLLITVSEVLNLPELLCFHVKE